MQPATATVWVKAEQVSFEEHHVNNKASGQQDTVTAFSANTFAAVTVPAGTQAVIIVPPTGPNTPAGTTTIKIKGVTGDTGISIDTQHSTKLGLAASATFGVLCNAACTITFKWI